MSQQRKTKRQSLTNNSGGNSSTGSNSTPHKRRRQTNQALEALGQLIKDPLIDDVDNKLNKNDILSLTLCRLLRRKYWSNDLPNKNVQMTSGIESSSIKDDLNGFILVLNTQGRIIFISDNVEYYLRKNAHALYPQLTTIYDCVTKDDHQSIHNILSTPTNTEQKVICTWNLPRGKRPSRAHAESKAMLMTGHFFFINNEENNKRQEPLFVARCEQILSSTPNIPTNSLGSTSPKTLRFVLTDQLNINEISSNTELLLGYKADELIDQSIKRFLPVEHLHILEKAREDCMFGQHFTTLNVLDLYTRDGDRLTFLCNTHILIEGRRKATKLGFLAQLIDPSFQYEFEVYAKKQNFERLKAAAAQQESTLILNLNLNPSATTNILSISNQQSEKSNKISSVHPVQNLPQRRKRRRLSNKVENELLDFINKDHQIPQTVYDSSESYISSSSESLPSSVSPMQEVGHMDEILSYFDDKCEHGKIKLIQDFPTIDDINYVFGINDHQEFSLITPTIPTCNFLF